MMKCPDCLEGRIPRLASYENFSAVFEPSSFVCPTCKGTGQVLDIQTIHEADIFKHPGRLVKRSGEVPDPVFTPEQQTFLDAHKRIIESPELRPMLEKIVERCKEKALENPDPKGREDEVIYKALEGLHDRHEKAPSPPCGLCCNYRRCLVCGLDLAANSECVYKPSRFEREEKPKSEGKGMVKRYMVEQGRYMVEMVEAEEYDRLQEQIKQIPPGTMYSANRYDTDDRMKLHVWDENGNSYDIDMPKSETCGHREG